MWVGYAANARAVTILYPDRPAWQTTVAGLGYGMTNIDFENVTKPDLFTVTAGDVIFYDINHSGGLHTVNSPTGYNSGKVLDFFVTAPVLVTLPGNVYAFGLDLGEFSPLSPPFYFPPTLSNVALSTGETFPGPYQGNPYPIFGFFGFLSDVPITSVSMLPHAITEAMIDNFTYAQRVTPVPEPSTMLLLGSGLAGLVGYGRRRMKK
jgi:PEP-CTERM putative exosortase interaction domain